MHIFGTQQSKSKTSINIVGMLTRGYGYMNLKGVINRREMIKMPDYFYKINRNNEILGMRTSSPISVNFPYEAVEISKDEYERGYGDDGEDD